MSFKNTNKIRNFCIIAHIDHGKSTLADRLLELTGTVNIREKKDRIMDTLELEQERGITIKLQTARMKWNYNNSEYILNLIDTPGHVDFSYEVSRSIAACEGAILLVDATQGVEAQTISTVMQAYNHDLKIIPVINKIDLPNAEIEKTKEEMLSVFGFKEEEILLTSGKTGQGAKELLDRVITNIPSPSITDDHNLKALIFDSFYDEHKGVVALVRIMQGEIPKSSKQRLYTMQKKTTFNPIEIGYLNPSLIKQENIYTGEVGYLATGLKEIKKIQVGDTVTYFDQKDKITPLAGYKKPLPMVYAGIYPMSNDDYSFFKDAVEKLSLNDASLTLTPESSAALGAGFRCGFLGLLHMEIIKERLQREFNVEILITAPSVRYEIQLTNNEHKTIKSPQDLPDPSFIQEIREPWAIVEIITPQEYIGAVMRLCQEKRGIYKNTEYINKQNVHSQLSRAILKYEIPIAELITDYFDQVKSLSRGYASFAYSFIEYRKGEIVKVDILVNEEKVPPLSFLTHRSNTENTGREIVEKLKDLIPKQQFKIPLQAAIGGKIIARETISALRKDVTAKLYGGDVTRKMKVLERQKKGKEKLKKFGRVEIPQEAFLVMMKKD